jgi:hypothetical protein
MAEYLQEKMALGFRVVNAAFYLLITYANQGLKISKYH